jgi:hypothetical protein
LNKKSDAKKTGTYKYDKSSDKIVKVSDSIPKVASKGGGGSAEDSDAGPCGRPSGDCGMGACGSN